MKRALGILGLVGCVDRAPVNHLPVELDGDLDIVEYHDRMQLPTALGGTQTFQLHYEGPSPGIPGPVFDQPYTAVVTDSRVRIEDQLGASITVRGVAPGQSALRVVHEDGSLIGEFSLSVAEIEKVVLDPVTFDDLPGDVLVSLDRSKIAWALGEQTLAVHLYRGTERVADSSLQITLTGAERQGHDLLHVRSAVVGTYPISVTAGNWPTTTVDFVVVDRADSMSLIADGEPAPTSLTAGILTSLCFQARSAGRYLLGLPWTIRVVGEIEPQAQGAPNCVAVIPLQTSGDITVSAAAAGQSLSMTLPVVAK
jgi:hypothetical protein